MGMYLSILRLVKKMERTHFKEKLNDPKSAEPGQISRS